MNIKDVKKLKEAINVIEGLITIQYNKYVKVKDDTESSLHDKFREEDNLSELHELKEGLDVLVSNSAEVKKDVQ